MAERSMMKRRVRGLFKKDRMKPLCALCLASLPMLLVTAVTLFVMPSPVKGVVSLSAQMREFVATTSSGGDLMVFGFSLMALLSHPLDYSLLIASIPACVIFIAVYWLIGMPVAVSTSGFMLAFLRGKEARVTDVFGCFSGKYPRILAGMLYKQLWVLVWGIAVVAAPLLFGIGAYTAAWHFLDSQMVNLQFQVYFFLSDIAISIVLFFILLFFFFNRLLAYHLTPICVAAQPNLPAFRAVRLSRRLMRGLKGSLIGLYMSFLSFYAPALVSGAALLLLSSFAAGFSIEEGAVSLIRMVFVGVITLNMIVTFYVAPYCSLCVRAFYIERKREALLDEELTPEDFASEPQRA